jgi:hypothetical protein
VGVDVTTGDGVGVTVAAGLTTALAVTFALFCWSLRIVVVHVYFHDSPTLSCLSEFVSPVWKTTFEHLSSVTFTLVNDVSDERLETVYEYVIFDPGVTVTGETLVVSDSWGDLAYAQVPAEAST